MKLCAEGRGRLSSPRRVQTAGSVKSGGPGCTCTSWCRRPACGRRGASEALPRLPPRRDLGLPPWSPHACGDSRPRIWVHPLMLCCKSPFLLLEVVLCLLVLAFVVDGDRIYGSGIMAPGTSVAREGISKVFPAKPSVAVAVAHVAGRRCLGDVWSPRAQTWVSRAHQ